MTEKAFDEISKIGFDEARRQVHSLDPAKVSRALWALGDQHGSNAAIWPLLMKYLEHTDPALRLTAARSLELALRTFGYHGDTTPLALKLSSYFDAADFDFAWGCYSAFYQLVYNKDVSFFADPSNEILKLAGLAREISIGAKEIPLETAKPFFDIISTQPSPQLTVVALSGISAAWAWVKEKEKPKRPWTESVKKLSLSGPLIKQMVENLTQQFKNPR